MPIDIWFTIALEALVHSEFECSKYLGHGLSLVYESSIGLLLSSRSSRKCWPLLSDDWSVIFQLLRISLHSFFLLKFQAQVVGNKMKVFSLLIHYVIEGLSAITRAILKFYSVIVIFIKEFSEFIRNQWYMNLKWVQWRVKYFLQCRWSQW